MQRKAAAAAVLYTNANTTNKGFQRRSPADAKLVVLLTSRNATQDTVEEDDGEETDHRLSLLHKS
jgi:hypothetical protein